jgi:hypothetical protein
MSYIYTHGSGTVEDPYQVWTAADLNGVREDLSAHYIQMADIDLSEYGDWIPIGEFNGVYDGNNFTISNLTVPLGDESIYYSWGLFEGIFGFLDMYFPENSVPAEVKNLTLENVNITGDYDVGALAGYSYGKITNCHSSGTVRGQFNVGGLLGSSYELSDLATEYQSDIIGCSSSCSLERTDFTTYAYCFGGLIGSANNLRIEQCFATGDIISPISDNHLRNCGGLLGTASPWNIPLDMRMTIKDCYATGNIQGDYNCGGMVGYTYTCDLINCYSSGSVNGVEDIGGFIGYMDETVAITSCYYDSQTSGQSDNDGRGIPKTTAEMTYPYSDPENVFINWAFYEENEDWVWVHDKPENKYDVTCTITDNNFIIDTCLVYGSNRAFCEYRYLAYLLHQEAYWDDYNLIFAGYDLTEHIKEYDDIVYLPVRYIAQDLLKLRVNWDETNQQVHIAGSVFGPINNGYPHFIKDVKLVYKILIPITGGTITYL